MPPGKKLLQTKNLASVAKLVPCQKAQFCKRIKDDPARPGLFHFLQHRPRGLTQFDLSGMEDSVQFVQLERILVGSQVSEDYTSKIPSVRGGHRSQFLDRF